MLSAFISSIHSYPALPLAEQLVHQRYVHPGPLVLRTDPLKFPTPATDRDRTVSGPESRLRHWCSSIYLRIPPLHMEFHSPLLHSRKTVSDAVPRLSRGLSHQTYSSACARFTPNKSGQRLPPTYYRGCWHVVSRDFLVDYRQIKASYYLYPSSPTTELYDPKTFFTHAALLHQTCVHCGRFPTAP